MSMKLDIEGAEYCALEGAARPPVAAKMFAKNNRMLQLCCAAGHIRSGTPTMVICIDHDQRGSWHVPLRVFETNDRYDLRARHYSEGVCGMAMFFTPKGNHENG